MTWLSDLLGIGGSPNGGSNNAPAAPTNPVINYDPSQASPVITPYPQWRGDNYGLSQFLNKLGAPALGSLFGPDTGPQNYNAALAQAYATKEKQYDTQFFQRNQPGYGVGGASGPADRSPAGALLPAQSAAPSPLGTQLSPGMTLGGAATPSYTPQGLPAMLASSGQPDAPSPYAPQTAGGGINIPTLMQRLQSSQASPASMAMAAPTIKLLESALTTGLGTDAQGNIIKLPGSNSAAYQTKRSEALGTGLLQTNSDGSVSNIPGVVSSAADKAGKIEGAQKWAGVDPANAITRFNTNEDIRKAQPVAQGTEMGTKLLTRDANGVIQNQPGSLNSLGNIEDAKPWSLKPGGFTEFDSHGNLRGQTSATQTGVDDDGAPTSRYAFPPVNMGKNFLGGPGFPAGSGGLTGTGSGGQQGTEPWRTGLPFAQKSFQEGRGTSLSKDFEGYGNAATAANQTQFTIDQMRNEARPDAGWTPGHFADWAKDFRSVLNGLPGNWSGPEMDAALANQQAFEKNSMQLTTQATKAVSPRAAAQEMLLIRDAMPQSKTSRGGLDFMFDQFTAINDFTKAKALAAENYVKTSPDKTSAGFEAQWNKSISPTAFLAHRMSNDQFTAFAANLAKSASGRALLQRTVGEMQFADKAGLFQGGN